MSGSSRHQDLSRHRSPFSLRHKVARALWEAVQATLFRWSPRPCHAWRRMLLRAFGAKVGACARMDPKCRVFAPWNLELGEWCVIGPWTDLHDVGRIRIGAHAMVSQYAQLIAGTHDATQASLPLVAQDVVVGDSAWVCAGAFIGPGVTVGHGALVAARAVVFQDVEPWVVVMGNPARKTFPRRILGDG